MRIRIDLGQILTGAAILIMGLVFGASVYRTIDFYLRYGHSWTVITIIEGVSETTIETVRSWLAVVGALGLVLISLIVNYWQLYTGDESDAEEDQQTPP